MTEEIYYLVRSGTGYFIRFHDGRQPLLTTDPVEATRFPTIEATDATRREMQEMGWGTKIVTVTHVHRFTQREFGKNI